MRNLLTPDINQFREAFRGNLGDDTCGIFVTPTSKTTRQRSLLISAVHGHPGFPWDALTVNVNTDRPLPVYPTAEEMDFCRKLFFEANETVAQIYPPLDVAKNVGEEPFTLSLFRPTGEQIEAPAIQKVSEENADAS